MNVVRNNPGKFCCCCCCAWIGLLISPLFVGLLIDSAYWGSVPIPRLVFNAIPPDDTAMTYLEVHSEEELLRVLDSAALQGKNVRTIGGGWSWNPGAYPTKDGILLGLRGDLSKITTSRCSGKEACTIDAGGGAWIYDLVPEIASAGYQINANGLCLNKDESQSVGGVIATNVHGSFSPTFASVVSSLRVAHFLPNGTAVAITYNKSDRAFEYAFGTVGRTGIVISATLLVEPLMSYTWERAGGSEGDLSSLWAESLNMETSCVASLVSMVGWASPRGGIETRCLQRDVIAKNETDLVLAPHDSDFVRNVIEGMVMWDRVLLGGSILAGFLEPAATSTFRRTGNWYKQNANLLNEQHIEMEFFVPFNQAAPALKVVQDVLGSNGHWGNALLALRQTPLTDAPLAASAGADALAINIDLFFDRDWEMFRKLQKDILDALRNLKPSLAFVRLHPGKFMAPGETLEAGNFGEDVITEFYELIDSADPKGVFRTPLCRRDEMAFTYSSRTPATAYAVAYGFWMLSLSALLLPILGGVLCCFVCYRKRQSFTEVETTEVETIDTDTKE